MEEPGLILFEYDLAVDCGVKLMVTPEATTHGTPTMRFAIRVDEHYLAAYVGPKDVDALIAFLQRNKG